MIAAVFFVILGVCAVAVALFLAMGYPGLLLIGGAIVAAVGLLAIPVDGRDR
jgi:hypothetical protein